MIEVLSISAFEFMNEHLSVQPALSSNYNLMHLLDSLNSRCIVSLLDVGG